MGAARLDIDVQRQDLEDEAADQTAGLTQQRGRRAVDTLDDAAVIGQQQRHGQQVEQRPDLRLDQSQRGVSVVMHTTRLRQQHLMRG